MIKIMLQTICFMAIDIDNKVLSSDDKSKLTYDELHDAFESLYDEFKNLGHKYSFIGNNNHGMYYSLLKNIH
ncbi:hypothetical protein NC653_008091 [Populus alba x Populus x berolinensis]|uniref:Uncharacterized protein n=1 Tax=Populus alba x Populus x berolinensis TaxID=444605 RepID=A0AAD6R5I9_9ROSI|nr:hypothetical protein NC653_008091 [Populus alba x Populus x berolinensis]